MEPYCKVLPEDVEIRNVQLTFQEFPYFNPKFHIWESSAS